MYLCFGTFASILKKSSLPGTTNRAIVSTLVGTIDPNNKYGEKNNDTAVSRLINCDRNFPVISVETNNGPIRSVDGPQTNIIALSKTISPSDLVSRFASVLCLLDEDKKIAAVGALHYLIETDDSLNSEHQPLFVKCLGDTAANIVRLKDINLCDFLARLFLYSVLLNDNTAGKSSLPEIRSQDFLKRFASCSVRIRPSFVAALSNAGLTSSNEEMAYMKKLVDKYNQLPTILHKEAFSPFRDYYVPNNVSWSERVPGERYYRIRQMSDVTLQKLTHLSRFLVLSGTGGLGKSMMMRNLILSSVDEYETMHIIPLFITLKDYETTYPQLIDYVFDMVHNLWNSLTLDSLTALLSSGKALLLFDGLDEIPTKDLAFFTKQLNAFIDRFYENVYIISSRPYSNFQTFTRFTVLQLQPFTKEQALKLVDQFNYRADAPKLQARFRNLLDTTLYWTHRGFAGNPLLLSIMLLTFEMDAEVPTLKYIFYQEAYTVLAKRHDASKDGYTRTMKTGWTSAEFAKYFAFFCAKTYSCSKVSFTYADMEHFFEELMDKYELYGILVDDFIYDAINNLCIMYQDGLNYGFIHRSFQEYFCAKFIHNQLDENLRNVISVFDCKDTTKKDDTALAMLFDMKPKAVEKYMLLPYLEEFVEECENGFGLWTFLEKIYPYYEIADGEAYADDDLQEPNSNLYAFILEHYGIPLLSIDPSKLKDIWFAESQTMVYREDTKEDVWNDDLPSGYEERYGEPEITGHLYRFDWHRIRTSVYPKALAASIEAKDSPFAAEYESIKKLLKELQHKAASVPKTKDPFENMF